MNIKQTNMSMFLELFTDQNRLRPTRLGVFEGKAGSMKDYWLEDGLPLMGVDIDSRGRGTSAIEIMLGKKGTAEPGGMTHVVRNVRTVSIVLNPRGDDDGLEIKDAAGNTTFLRFENVPVVAPNSKRKLEKAT